MSELEELFKKKELARQWLETLGLQNIVGRSPEERVQMDLAYEKAVAEMMTATTAYRDAIRAKSVERK